MVKRNFLGDDNLDKIMRVVISLARETYILKDRLSLLERIMNKKGYISQHDFSNYIFSDNEREEVRKESEEFINSIMMPITTDYNNSSGEDKDGS
tara:strand:+ start:47 stop:331 length:285 start_codon:yes stop_codon:yes gene_type:complete